jgi:preprotein translocase subunit SecG
MVLKEVKCRKFNNEKYERKTNMQQILLILHILFAVILIGLVLLQRGKGGMGSAFGSGGASQTVFGSKGTSGFLIKLTMGFAALFFITSITLTYLASKQQRTSPVQELLSVADEAAKMQQPKKADKDAEIKKTFVLPNDNKAKTETKKTSTT